MIIKYNDNQKMNKCAWLQKKYCGFLTKKFLLI